MRAYGFFLLVTLIGLPSFGQESPQSDSSKANQAASNASVKPGINDSFLDPDLQIDEWIERFEVESREVYHARNEILERLKLKKGMRVADVGAGTGFYTLLMSEAVGSEGWTYAIDIAPAFIQHLGQLIAAKDISNATVVFCNDRSICLPPNSIDLAFICDVYHHFEYPMDTMASIYRALRNGGRVIVIDFERIPGVSREWLLGHVRAGKQTFIDEVQSAGFRLIAEREISGFEENYFLEFAKEVDSKSDQPGTSR